MVLHVHEYDGRDATHENVTGPPVVALHGIKGHGARWRRLAERHTTGLRLFGLDLLGHGRSPYEPPWHVGAHVAAVVTTLDARGLDQVDLIGHSYGGLVGTHLARAHPGRVRRLILLDPALSIDPIDAGRGAAHELQPLTFASPEAARTWRAEHWLGVTDPTAIDDEVAEHLQPGEDGQWRWRFNPATIVTAYSEMAIPAPPPPDGLPTLLVVAGKGSSVNPETLRAWRARSELELTVVEVDCGHMVYLELPEQAGDLVQHFLSA